MNANSPLRKLSLAATAWLALAAAPAAAQFNVTNTFSSNTPALASEVNRNFDDVENELDSKLDDSNGSVDAGNLATNSVGSAEIQSNAVGASEIASGAVTTSKIADDAVTSAKIADNAITNDHIAAAAISASKISGDAGFEAAGFTNIEVTTAATGGVDVLGSLEVDAPASGAILVFLSASVRLTQDVALNYGINIDDDTGFAGGVKSGTVGISGGTSSASDHSISAVQGFVVSEGTHTVHGLANKVEIFAGSANVSGINMVAIFIPKQL